MIQLLSTKEILKLIAENFIYKMPFNCMLELELESYEKEFVKLSFNNKPVLIGNWMKNILHGGVIASALDITAGLVCVGSVLTRCNIINKYELYQRLSHMGTINLHVNYLRPGRGNRFTAISNLLRAGNKIAVSCVNLYNEKGIHIATATANYMIG